MDLEAIRQKQSHIRLFLKSQLKARGYTYKKMAAALSISEITFKKWMTSRDIKLENLAKIGDVLDVDLVDVLKMDRTDSPNFKLYSPEQDHYLANYAIDLAVFVKLIVGNSREQILRKLNLSDKVLSGALVRLEKFGLIESWPGEKIKFKLKGPYLMRENGEMIQKVMSSLRDHLFQHFRKKFPALTRMNSPDASSMFRAFEFYLSQKSQKEYVQDLMRIIAKYSQIGEMELKQGHSTEPVCSIIAVDQVDGFAKMAEQ